MQYLSDLASLATLILFIFYFIGRLWTGLKNLKYMQEKFDVDSANNTIEYENELDLGGQELIKISSRQSMKWIKIYNVIYNPSKNKFSKESPSCLKSFQYIASDEPTYIKTDIPEGYPNLMIVFERFDCVRGSFLIGYNGKCGGMCPVDYKMHLTVKAILYYLLR